MALGGDQQKIRYADIWESVFKEERTNHKRTGPETGEPLAYVHRTARKLVNKNVSGSRLGSER